MTTAWPDGVVARYLTVAGVALSDPNITVDVTDTGKNNPICTATCAGCSASESYTSGLDRHGVDGDQVLQRALADARTWAQAHAETCRAMPAPTN